jgi:hypothetical protein
LKEATEMGFGMILSTLSERNVAFYTRLGFKEIYRDCNYPFHPKSQEVEKRVFCAVMIVHA